MEGCRVALEHNKDLVRRLWDEVWNGGDLNAADDILAPQFAHAEKQRAAVVRAAFPNSTCVVQAILAEDDRVISCIRWEGVHRGEQDGSLRTHNHASFNGVWIHRVVDGRLLELWCDHSAIRTWPEASSTTTFRLSRSARDWAIGFFTIAATFAALGSTFDLTHRYGVPLLVAAPLSMFANWQGKRAVRQ
jgi:predicted ester cyclase